ncbi:hypothetical protein HJO_05785 [Hyphomonas johnsonii MHS-2]|uniref:Gylcosyl hydrolase 115 C-terminal domain-containing protein n=2 Tax=Hyphomonas johnsonii TaxID=81031 RepID=A0A059FRU9_9PROT|nr:hypothetical protein HJO_05785 [Hyphomonas johnsonii MHS-2]
MPAADIVAHPFDGAFPLFDNGAATAILVDPAEDTGVLRAVRNLQADLEKRGGARPEIRTAIPGDTANLIIVGELGKSRWVSQLRDQGRISADGVAGEWEAFSQEVIDRPFDGVERALVITGADKRGTIYGVYDLLDRAGVSPWAWWADVPIEPIDALYVAPGRRVEKPEVKYRGIFLNDENPALYGWVNEKFGGFNHGFYEHVYDLLLRLKANYLWPAMWGKAFYDDDPLNAELADEYGIVIGTSHHEPLGRAHVEWERYGTDDWNYATNKDTLDAFWRYGMERIGDREAIVTIGMRGDGDEAMTEGTAIGLLERIVRNQREIIEDVTGKPASETPQIWALYKEVQDYYDQGMQVPDDVTLLFADDNWGNIRRLPEPGVERDGGYGVYYHFDYVGDPRNYKWINTTQIERVWEQMNLADAYGAKDIWIVNVGDLKPMEFPIDFFLDLAWDPADIPLDRLAAYPAEWAAEQFGPAHAAEIGALLTTYTKYNARRKPELLEPGTYSLLNYREADRVVADYNALAERATALRAELPASQDDAYMQLVWFPIHAAANLNELYVTAAKNHLHAQQHRASTNALADRVEQLFAKDAELARIYHEDISDGKWNHLMSQTHIGYSYWQQPEQNNMPDVVRIDVPAPALPGVSVPGTEDVSMTVDAVLTMPVFDPYGRPVQTFDVFNGGQTPFPFEVSTDADWVRLSAPEMIVKTEIPVTVSIDWARVPAGTSSASVWVSSGETRIPVTIPVHTFEVPAEGHPFIETGGIVSFDASDAHRFGNGDTVQWKIIPNLGRTGDSITPFPVTAASQTPGADGSPRLDYNIYVTEPGTYTADVTLAPSLDFRGKGGLRYAISVNDAPPQVVNINRDTSPEAWRLTVADYANVQRTEHVIEQAGLQHVTLWMVDPGVVFEHVTLARGPVPDAYLGPPASPQARR